MFFYNALQLWNNISDNEFVYSTDLKKFRSNYFDCIMRKFTPDTFKTDRIFLFFINVISIFIIPSYFVILVFLMSVIRNVVS